ncbi:MAG: NADH-quinone oxidoreductase subunit N [Acidocella sp. 20-57-95]|nr:MAG: NADH-quinone oxidoreductase subunit N [Acidocella sp. 20-57-95]OYV60417.1 MAG: NADH-quinone oxidoreductase subunit N [Acidocella sp. 21-58-7]HQT63213.1 NADH-quinone oxidoreductase subunit NuoN [Acidocella sp.]HQU03539.1 NADH-quinone oxidoreductase subunit NuoN [Acidocella sp.]
MSPLIPTLLPELALGLGGMVLLLAGVLSKSNQFVHCSLASIALFVVTALLVLAAPSGTIYDGLLITSNFTRFADVLVLLGASAALILSLDYNQREDIARFEFPVLVVLAVLGMIVMISAADMMTLYLGFELQSLALYICAAFARDSLRSTEAGLKYFVLGALASGLLIYGISLVYGFAGTTNFASLAQQFSTGQAAGYGTVIGVVFVLVGIAFKISAAPFHMWTPDVYEGAPTPVTALFGTAPKVAAMALLVSVMVGPFGHLLSQWQMLIEILSVISMLLGALAAIGQSNIKRLMAYSSIGHMGYALIGLAAGTAAGVQATLIYMSVYVVMSFGVFACILAMRRKGQAVETIADLAGLSTQSPAYALALAVLMWSMAGIPPLSGFFGKLYVFSAAINAGLDVLAVVGVLTSVVGAFYYLRVIKVMYFDAGSPDFDKAAGSVRFVMAVAALATALFVFIPGPLVSAAAAAARALMG